MTVNFIPTLLLIDKAADRYRVRVGATSASHSVGNSSEVSRLPPLYRCNVFSCKYALSETLCVSNITNVVMKIYSCFKKVEIYGGVQACK